MAEYCRDYFTMVEDTDDSFRLWQGLVGPHYTPSVSNDGTLSWSNNGNLPNPESVNLRGPQGAGIRIAGIVETEEGLPASAADGAIWLVGEGSPYEGYAWIGGEWIDLGPLTVGPAGPPGPQGDDYVLTETDKAEIAQSAEALLLTELDNEPLGVRYGGTGARTVEGAQEMLGIDDIEEKLGDWPLGTDAQDVSGAINEMIGEISLQVADIQQLKDNFAGEFSPTSTYTVGQYVVYGGKFYRCTTAVTTAGSWADANWTQVTAGGELQPLVSVVPTYVRPNMLDNWFFGNGVINQRGQSSYSGNTYAIDRWKGYATASTMAIQTDCIRIKRGSGQYYNYFQVLDDLAPALAGKTVTASVLLKNAYSGAGLDPCYIRLIDSSNTNLASVRIEGESKLFSVTTALSSSLSTLRFAIYTGTNNLDIEAVKLEIGTTQTLAHQQNGVWVLNEIPNFAEELAKCRFFFERLTGQYNFISSGFFRTASQAFTLANISPKRARTESVTLSGTVYVNEAGNTGSNAHAATGLDSGAACAPNGQLFLSFTGLSSMAVGMPCIVQFRDSSSYIDVSAEL